MSNEKASSNEIIDVFDLPTLSEIRSKKNKDIYSSYNSINDIPENGIVLFLATNGKSFKYNSIIRITALKYENFQKIDYLDLYDITNLKDAIKIFLDFIEDYPIVWHTNEKRNFIGKALKENGFDMIQNEFFITMKKAKELLFAVPGYGLYQLADFFKIHIDYTESLNDKKINTCFKLLLELHKLELEIYS